MDRHPGSHGVHPQFAPWLGADGDMRGRLRRTGCRVASNAAASKHAPGIIVLESGGVLGSSRSDPRFWRITELTASRSVFCSATVHALESAVREPVACAELGQGRGGVRVA